MSGGTQEVSGGADKAPAHVSHAERCAEKLAGVRASGLTPRVADWLQPLLNDLPERHREIVMDYARKTGMGAGNYAFFLVLACLKSEESLDGSARDAARTIDEMTRSSTARLKEASESLSRETRDILEGLDRTLSPFVSTDLNPSPAAATFAEEIIRKLDFGLSKWSGSLASRVRSGAESCVEDALQREHSKISEKICAQVTSSLEKGVLKRIRATAEKIEGGKIDRALDRTAWFSAGLIIGLLTIFAMLWG